MRIALVGCGRIGHLHGRVLAADPRVDELIVADLDPQRAAALAEHLGVRTASVAGAVELADALVIAAATDAHASLIRAGVARRLPVFCEKPLALDLAETIRLVHEIEAAGTPFQLGFQRRFDLGYREAQAMVADGRIGHLYQVRMTATDHTPPPDEYVPTSGGLFRDSAIHDFDALRFVTGSEVASLHTLGGVLGFPVFGRHGDVDAAVVNLRLANGVLATLAVGRHNPRGYDIRMELLGSGDAVAVGLSGRTPIHALDGEIGAASGGRIAPTGSPDVDHQPAWDSFLDRFEAAYRAELGAFVRVAAGEEASACSARDGLEAMRIADAATRSVAEGRPVNLAEIDTAGEKEVAPNVPR